MKQKKNVNNCINNLSESLNIYNNSYLSSIVNNYGNFYYFVKCENGTILTLKAKNLNNSLYSAPVIII